MKIDWHIRPLIKICYIQGSSTIATNSRTYIILISDTSVVYLPFAKWRYWTRMRSANCTSLPQKQFQLITLPVLCKYSQFFSLFSNSRLILVVKSRFRFENLNFHNEIRFILESRRITRNIKNTSWSRLIWEKSSLNFLRLENVFQLYLKKILFSAVRARFQIKCVSLF